MVSIYQLVGSIWSNIVIICKATPSLDVHYAVCIIGYKNGYFCLTDDEDLITYLDW